jgi:hypothetical protein
VSKYKHGSTFFYTFQLEAFDKADYIDKQTKMVISDTGGIKEGLKLANISENPPTNINNLDLERTKSVSNIRIMKDGQNDIKDVFYLYRNF